MIETWFRKNRAVRQIGLALSVGLFLACIVPAAAMPAPGGASAGASAVPQDPEERSSAQDETETSNDNSSMTVSLMRRLLNVFQSFVNTATDWESAVDLLQAPLERRTSSETVQWPENQTGSQPPEENSLNGSSSYMPSTADVARLESEALENVSQSRAMRSARFLLVAVGIVGIIGLLRLLLHFNHLSHGNYAGRLQFIGWVGSVLVLVLCLGVALNDGLWELPSNSQASQAPSIQSHPGQPGETPNLPMPMH